ncbi:MAG: DUF4982 domain-containing protein [Chthoniobacteraceae bacterium]
MRLELNGKVIGEKPASEATELTAKFDVPYAPGELRAIGLVDGKVIAQTVLKTAGVAKRLKLVADRSKITTSRNDLSYVSVVVVDENGQRVPGAKVPVRLSVGGVGELAAQGNGSPNEPASFREPVCTTFEGRCLAILRPTGGAGSIILRADAEGLDASSIVIQAR